MWKRIGDLMYEEKNLQETIAYCKAHNSVIHDADDKALTDEFFKRVARRTGGFTSIELAPHVGSMDTAFNAFFVIDPFDKQRASVPMEQGAEPGTHVINFFVRMGRKPVAEENAI